MGTNAFSLTAVNVSTVPIKKLILCFVYSCYTLDYFLLCLLFSIMVNDIFKTKSDISASLKSICTPLLATVDKFHKLSQTHRHIINT